MEVGYTLQIREFGLLAHNITTTESDMNRKNSCHVIVCDRMSKSL